MQRKEVQKDEEEGKKKVWKKERKGWGGKKWWGRRTEAVSGAIFLLFCWMVIVCLFKLYISGFLGKRERERKKKGRRRKGGRKSVSIGSQPNHHVSVCWLYPNYSWVKCKDEAIEREREGGRERNRERERERGKGEEENNSNYINTIFFFKKLIFLFKKR